MDKMSRSNIEHEGGTLEVMSQRGNQGKRPRKVTLGKTGEYNKVSVPGQKHTGGIGMDNDGTNT